MVRFLEERGFGLLRVRGSHYFLDRAGMHTTIPVHRNSPLKIGTLCSILRDIQLSPAEFTRLLGE
ncbi:MAG TPA: type II toxin-antitoxin system HicA family toxin [Pirellulales bacterium]|jgi:predicted RNA binding protein YcfA (HicA-like mRNA interferase family)|nr:type II toxin-antitoxin system HicA family toxin [Pirellulales bacterium]